MAHYHPEQLVFVDETGCDRNTSARVYGWAPSGDRAHRHDFFVSGSAFRKLNNGHGEHCRMGGIPFREVGVSQ